MEVGKINTPTAAYQGSGPELAAKKETEVSSGMQAEKRVVSDTAAVINPSYTSAAKSEDDKQNGADAQETANMNQIKRAVDEVNRKVKNNELIFGIHEATNRVTIKVIDKGTKEVLREFPPEQTLDMIAKVWELAGIMVDERR
ncbi:MAG: flagellar protein FlaG [Lachnospiraceae bacterium]|jgi:flagellar protein FlaG|nr:flagellar protein FlaG [Lachnospiraceae bacterium]